MIHTPVLLNGVIKYLDPKPGQKFIDATINGGGHAFAILDKIGRTGKLLGIEQDKNLFNSIQEKIQRSKFRDNVILVNDNFKNLKKIGEDNGFIDADEILFDFGMSSWHIEESGRGFSFMKDEPLDMRFYEKEGITAADILNGYKQENIEYIIREYGGERFAKSIAREIVRHRKEKEFKNTFDLVEVIKKATPLWYRTGRRIHSATKTFQALRIEVNQELENIKSGLEGAIKTLKPGGKIATISFHSLEDKIVKNQFRGWIKEGRGIIITKKPIKPSTDEIRQNPRSRSAALRIFQKNDA